MSSYHDSVFKITPTFQSKSKNIKKENKPKPKYHTCTQTVHWESACNLQLTAVSDPLVKVLQWEWDRNFKPHFPASAPSTSTLLSAGEVFLSADFKTDEFQSEQNRQC